MYNAIDFQKFTDIIDESIMCLYFLKKDEEFPVDLKNDLLNILSFFSKAKDDKLEEVLHDNMISIDITDLNAIKEKLHDVKIEDIDIPALKHKIEGIGSKNLSNEEIDTLESELIDLSTPLWQTEIY
jgi:hypothetical protein